jgi:hypothetical protein
LDEDKKMETTKYNLTIKAGATFEKRFSMVDENDSAISLVGYTGSAQVKTRANGEVLATFAVTVDGAGGSFTLALTAAETGAIAGQSGVYDVYLTSASDVLCPVEGQVEVSAKVTT